MLHRPPMQIAPIPTLPFLSIARTMLAVRIEQVIGRAALDMLTQGVEAVAYVVRWDCRGEVSRGLEVGFADHCLVVDCKLRSSLVMEIVAVAIIGEGGGRRHTRQCSEWYASTTYIPLLGLLGRSIVGGAPCFWAHI